MRRFGITGLCLSIAMAAFAAMNTEARAHPHAWIDLRTSPVFDKAGRVSGLKVHWTFDEFYTLFTIEVIDPDGDGTADAELVRELAKENLKNLADYSYFTYFKVDGEQPDYDTVTEYDSYLEADRLVMTFTVPLAEPVDPVAKPVSYAVYDPTYYIEIFHTDPEAAALGNEAPERCKLRLEPPSPDPEMVSLAASLDQTESAGDGLGEFFAERVFLDCD
jgi:ABC-type uncharacterized transport system substrate-binding protein